MKYTLKYTFSIVLVLFSLVVNAQVSSVSEQPKETTAKTDSIPPKKERYGIRVGVDLFKLTRSFYEDDYRGIEFVGDYRLTRKHYLAAEIGNENKTVDDDGDGVSGYLNAEDESQKHFLVNFVNFENFIGLASVFPYSNVVSNLYAYDGQYFLELVFFQHQPCNALKIQLFLVVLVRCRTS